MSDVDAPESLLVRNEQAKLTATYLNGLAIAAGAIGGIGPWIAYIQGGPASVVIVALCSAACFSLSGAVHVLARLTLLRLVG